MTEAGEAKEPNTSLNLSQEVLQEMDSIQIEKSDRNEQGLLLAPNHETSFLDENMWKFVRTPTFKKWFGDWQSPDAKTVSSNVRDQNGEPLVVYHGTTATFDKFDLKQIGKNRDAGYFGSGFYFTPYKQFAEQYGPRVISAFLNIRNMQRFEMHHRNARFRDDNRAFPEEIQSSVQEIFEQLKVLDDKKWKEVLSKSNGWDTVDSRGENYEHVWSSAIQQALQEIGRDGVEGINPISKLVEYTVFTPEQIFIIPSLDFQSR